MANIEGDRVTEEFGQKIGCNNCLILIWLSMALSYPKKYKISPIRSQSLSPHSL